MAQLITASVFDPFYNVVNTRPACKYNISKQATEGTDMLICYAYSVPMDVRLLCKCRASQMQLERQDLGSIRPV